MDTEIKQKTGETNEIKPAGEDGQANQRRVTKFAEGNKVSGVFAVPYVFLRNWVLRIGKVPDTLKNGTPIPAPVREKLAKELVNTRKLQASPTLCFVCVRSGQMVTNRQMNTEKLANRRWVPVPSRFASKVEGWNNGQRCKWARWVSFKLIPRLRAQGAMDQLDIEARKFKG